MKLSHQAFAIFGKPEAVGGGAFVTWEAPPPTMMRGGGLHKLLNGGSRLPRRAPGIPSQDHPVIQDGEVTHRAIDLHRIDPLSLLPPRRQLR
jgi:hypothetical protein